MAQKEVFYTVRYKCMVDANDPDAIANIDIPQGGANNSVYCEGSFDPEIDEDEAVCEGCGKPCEYDSEMCLCDECSEQ